jgi:hypothetical protein
MNSTHTQLFKISSVFRVLRDLSTLNKYPLAIRAAIERETNRILHKYPRAPDSKAVEWAHRGISGRRGGQYAKNYLASRHAALERYMEALKSAPKQQTTPKQLELF